MPHWCGIEGEAVKIKSWESIMNIRRFNQLIFLITATLALAGCAKNPESGSSSYAAQTTVLTAENGMTLYVLDKDQGYESSCYNKCAVNWPPYVGTADGTKPDIWQPMQRSDGTIQWTYDGKPVYFFKGDTAEGDAKGDGKDGVWHVVNAS
jgi:predicted lipoprotein with Yx(FWY)xxD motif